MSSSLREAALRWQTQGRAAILVEVAAARGSVPREPGTRMLVAADEVLGSIGGGHLELQAIADARGLLAESEAGATSVTFERHVALGPSLGQCCGGVLDLRFTPLAQSRPTMWPPAEPRFSLQLYGAGHVGRAVVRLLADLPCRVWWIDEREAEFPPGPLPAHIERVCVEPVEAEVAAAPAGCCYLVLTHSHDLDLAITHAILGRDDVAWFGLIGSKTKRARFEHRLLERGLPGERIASMVCPIGLPSIRGKEPELIALAVVAQILQQAR